MLTNFNEHPFSYVFGGRLSTVKQPGLGLDKFIEGVRIAYGISDAEYVQIQADAQNIPARNGLNGAQKELALIMRMATKKNPSALGSFKASASPAEYERWVR